jgi:BirA family biotin operon repressor/biotin-[acetyl-CoA-carboxylase] ligase
MADWGVHYVDETGSTNAVLLAMARDGAPERTVLRAGYQTAGRGRLGRTWLAPPGSALLASILLRPEGGPGWRHTAAVALAAADACRDLCGVEPGLKWPNDLVVGERKLAGVLAEADSGSGAVVVGIGLNCRFDGQAPDEIASVAVALDELAGPKAPEPASVLSALLDRLDAWLEAPDLPAAFRRRCVTLGRRVQIEDIDGEAVDVTDEGRLLVETGTCIKEVSAGDVHHR